MKEGKEILGVKNIIGARRFVVYIGIKEREQKRIK